MNAQELARTAYASPAAPLRTARSTEYSTFAQITHRLRTAAQTKKTSFPAYVSALNENRRLWTLLAGDVASDGNELPKELRAQIFYLAEFTHKHTTDILNGKTDEAALIEINSMVMRGLRHEGGQE